MGGISVTPDIYICVCVGVKMFTVVLLFAETISNKNCFLTTGYNLVPYLRYFSGCVLYDMSLYRDEGLSIYRECHGRKKTPVVRKPAVRIYPTPLLRTGCYSMSICQAKNSWSEFKSFFLLDWLPNQNYRTKPIQLFAHSWVEKRCVHAFLEGICTKGNTNELVPDLNSG